MEYSWSMCEAYFKFEILAIIGIYTKSVFNHSQFVRIVRRIVSRKFIFENVPHPLNLDMFFGQIILFPSVLIYETLFNYFEVLLMSACSCDCTS